jgi:hypothetical protein
MMKRKKRNPETNEQGKPLADAGGFFMKGESHDGFTD